MSITKLTVTISSDNYREIEENRKKQNLSSSAFVDRILRAYFEEKMKDELVKRYMEGYIKTPEDTKFSASLRIVSRISSYISGDN